MCDVHFCVCNVGILDNPAFLIMQIFYTSPINVKYCLDSISGS